MMVVARGGAKEESPAHDARALTLQTVPFSVTSTPGRPLGRAFPFRRGGWPGRRGPRPWAGASRPGSRPPVRTRRLGAPSRLFARSTFHVQPAAGRRPQAVPYPVDWMKISRRMREYCQESLRCFGAFRGADRSESCKLLKFHTFLKIRSDKGVSGFYNSRREPFSLINMNEQTWLISVNARRNQPFL